MYYIVLVILFILIQIKRPNDKNSQCIFYIVGGQTFNDTKSNNRKQPVIKYIPNRTIGRQQQIPYVLFQTHEMDVVPWKMKYGIGSIVEKNPQFTYRYFNATQRRDFIKSTFDQVVLLCYDSLNAKAFQADLFRYLVVYYYGGCYMDVSYIMIDSLVTAFPTHTTFYASVDGLPENYQLFNGYFCAKAGNKILYNIINLSVQGIKKFSYEKGMLDVTGPEKFATAFKMHYNTNKLVAGVYNKGESIVSERNWIHPCMIFSMLKLDNSTLVYTRYPDYRWDVQHYINFPHYGQLYLSKTLYDTSIKMPQQDYTFPLLEQIDIKKKRAKLFPYEKS